MQASIRSSIHQGLRPRQPTQRRVPAAYLCQGQRGGWSQALGLRLDLAALMNDDGVHGAAHSRLAALLVLRGAGEPVTRGGDPSHLWDPPHTDCLDQPRCLKLEKQGPPAGARPGQSSGLSLPRHRPRKWDGDPVCGNCWHSHSWDSPRFSALRAAALGPRTGPPCPGSRTERLVPPHKAARAVASGGVTRTDSFCLRDPSVAARSPGVERETA